MLLFWWATEFQWARQSFDGCVLTVSCVFICVPDEACVGGAYFRVVFSLYKMDDAGGFIRRLKTNKIYSVFYPPNLVLNVPHCIRQRFLSELDFQLYRCHVTLFVLRSRRDTLGNVPHSTLATITCENFCNCETFRFTCSEHHFCFHWKITALLSHSHPIQSVSCIRQCQGKYKVPNAWGWAWGLVGCQGGGTQVLCYSCHSGPASLV